MPTAKTGKWGPGAVVRAAGLVARPTTFYELVADQNSIAASAGQISATLGDTLSLAGDVAEIRTVLASSVGPGLQMQESQIRHVSERVARLEERFGATMPALELPRLDAELDECGEAIGRLDERIEALRSDLAALDKRLAGVEAKCAELVGAVTKNAALIRRKR